MWTGWRRVELSKMHESIKEAISSSENRSSELAMIIFWMKLRTNLTYEQISMIINYKALQEDWWKRASEACPSVQDALPTHVVLRFLGANHLTRAQALAHQTVYSKAFFGDNVALIRDGTYYFIQKSQAHAFQRKVYSLQKKRYMIKMLAIVFPDGCMVDTIDLFSGVPNDASIAENILGLNDSSQLWAEDGGTMIVNRGFRDSIESLEEAGFEVRMLAFLPAHQNSYQQQMLIPLDWLSRLARQLKLIMVR